MKGGLLYLFVFAGLTGVSAQRNMTDSVLALIKQDKQDTDKVEHLVYLARYLRDKDKPQRALCYADTAITLAQKINDKQGLVSAYSTLGIIYTRLSNYPKAIEYTIKALDLAEKIGNKKAISHITASLGVAYWEEEDYLKALNYDLKALKLEEEINDKAGIAMSDGNIAGVYYRMGSKERALIYYSKALAADSSLNDENGIAIDLANIGSVYKELGRYREALIAEEKALSLDHELNNRRSAADATCNIGYIYTSLKDYSLGENYLKEALRIAESDRNTDVEKDASTALASLYSATGRWQQAYQYEVRYESLADSLLNKDKVEQIGKVEAKADYDRQLTLEQAKEEQSALLANDDKQKQRILTWLVASIAIAIALIAAIIFRSLKIARKQKKLIEKQKILVEEKNQEVMDSIKYAKSLQDAILPPISLIKQHLPESFVFYKPKDIVAGDFYWMEVIPAPLNPPIRGIFEGKNIMEPDYYNADPSLYEGLKEKSKEFRNQPTEAEISAWNLLKGNSIGFHIRRQHVIGQYIVDFVNIKTRTIIEIDGEIHNYQKEEDEQRTNWLKKQGYEVLRYKNEEVLGNTENFLLSLQSKLKEREGRMSKVLPDGEDLGGAVGSNVILIAAADCTGHGVPGAMVSVVCSNALNRAINEFKIRDTGRVLDKARELILETFEKSERDVKDGMDISFCALIPTAKGVRLEWSGAYNPLWIIPTGPSSVLPIGEEDNKVPLMGGDRGAAIIELPPDKQPVGKQEGQRPFTTHTFDLSKGDTLYLFTDGYADQFGGPKGKKFKYKQLQQLLIDNVQLSMDEQKATLEQTLKEWKGTLEQVDDILIIGIKV